MEARADGTCWVNMGDCYWAGNAPFSNSSIVTAHRKDGPGGRGAVKHDLNRTDIKPKDLVGMPWRLAFALQAAGWWLRSDIIWSKPNPLPESVTDRPTKAHEYVFLLTKSARYFYDAEAVREDVKPGNDGSMRSPKMGADRPKRGARDMNEVQYDRICGANRRTVWEIATHAFPEAHFATFPPKLVEPCIRAGTSERGCCPECGAPWERVVERTSMEGALGPKGRVTRTQCSGTVIKPATSKTIGFRPTCACFYGPGFSDTKPSVALDPFFGAGTVAVVAREMGLRTIGIELSPEYCEIAKRRLEQGVLF